MSSDLKAWTSGSPMQLVDMPLPEPVVSRELSNERNGNNANNGHYNRSGEESGTNRQQQNEGRSGYPQHIGSRPQPQQSHFLPELQQRDNNFVQNMAERSAGQQVNHCNDIDFGMGGAFDSNLVNSTMANQHLPIGSPMSANVNVNLVGESNQHLNSFYRPRLYEPSHNNRAELALPPLPLPLPTMLSGQRNYMFPMPQCELNLPYFMARSFNNSGPPSSFIPYNDPQLNGQMPLWVLPGNPNYHSVPPLVDAARPPPGFGLPFQPPQNHFMVGSEPPHSLPNVYLLDEHSQTIFNTQLRNAQMKEECNRDLVKVLQEINELVFGPAGYANLYEIPIEITSQATAAGAAATAANTYHASGRAPTWIRTESMPTTNNNEKSPDSSRMLYSEVAAIGSKCNQEKMLKKNPLNIANVQEPNEFGNATTVGNKPELAENPYGSPNAIQQTNRFQNYPGQQSAMQQQPDYKWPPIQHNQNAQKDNNIGHGQMSITVVDADVAPVPNYYQAPPFNGNNSEWMQPRAFNQNQRQQNFETIRRPKEVPNNNSNKSGNDVVCGQNRFAMGTDKILPLQMWQ